MKILKVSYWVSFVVIVLVIAISILSLIHDTEHRYLKMLDFARLQIFIGGLIALVIFIWLDPIWKWYDTTLVIVLSIVLLCQLSYIVHYTTLFPKNVPNSIDNQTDLSLMIYNVYLENDNYDEAITMIQNTDADIVLALEVNDKWDKQLNKMKSQYPFYTETINEVGYGMVVYSKYKLENLSKYYLHNKKVPSYEFEVQLKSDYRCKLYTVHPPPPTYFEEMPDNKGKEEKELTLVGDKIKKDTLPVVVIGDMNDVAWGKTERLMQSGEKLKDVRVGRGAFNSFSAHSWWMHWPLDHIFVTEEFSVADLKLLDNCGSDHYPVYVELSLH